MASGSDGCHPAIPEGKTPQPVAAMSDAGDTLMPVQSIVPHSHMHKHEASAPHYFQHNQTVNVVQDGHSEEKGKLYQDAVAHTNECSAKEVPRGKAEVGS